MKILKLLIILFMMVTVSNAKYEDTFHVEDIEKSGDFFDIDTLTVKYSLDFLMGEMVLKANAKYTLGNYITIDGVVYRLNEFPNEVKNKLKLTELKVQVGVVSSFNLPNMNVQIDMGAMAQPNQWSYNTPSSPNWNTFIYSGLYSAPMYLSKEKTIEVMKQFKRFGLGENLSDAKTISIGYDISAARDYLLKQKKQAEKKITKTTEIKEKKKYSSQMMDILNELGGEKYRYRPDQTIVQPTHKSTITKKPVIKENSSTNAKKTKTLNTNSSTSVKSGKNWWDQIDIQNTKWSIHYSYEDKEGKMTIRDNKVNVQYMYNGKKDLLWKYTILNNSQKNCWVMTGPKGFKYGKAYGKEKYYLIYDSFDKQAVIVPYSIGYKKAVEFARKPANYYFKLKI